MPLDSNHREKFIDDKGYVQVYMPNHPHHHSGYVYEHRLVVEMALGRYLERCETVHHIDYDKTHNSLKNLFLCTPEEHIAIHSRGIKRSQEQNKKIRKTLRGNEIERKKEMKNIDRRNGDKFRR